MLALETDMRIIAQVDDLDRLLSSMQSFKGCTVLFSTGLKPDLPAMVHCLREAECRGVLIAERAESYDTAAAAELAGILGRSVTARELTECLRRVNRGQRYVQSSHADAAQAHDSVGARVRDRLTPKEMQIVALIVQGCKNKDIALQLGTKEQVIKNYLRSIYDKTGVSDRLELALFTLHHRILAEAAAKVGTMLEMRMA